MFNGDPIVSTERKIALDSLEAVPIPDDYNCPITQDLMEDPVTAADGHSYERQSITEWLRIGHRNSPKTGAQLAHTNLTPNYTLRTIIQDFKQGLPKIQRENQIRTDLNMAIQLREEAIRDLQEKNSNLRDKLSDKKELEEQLDQAIREKEAAVGAASVLETSLRQLESQTSLSVHFSYPGSSSLNSGRNVQASDIANPAVLGQRVEVKDDAEHQAVVEDEFNYQLKLAKAGYSPAQLDVALIYERNKDENKAREWYERAAKQGNADAQYHLAMMCEYGRGGPSNEDKASEFYEKAAKQGHTQAQYNLGMLHNRRNGYQKSFVSITKWLTPAAEKMNAQAQYRLGMECFSGRGGHRQGVKEACQLWQLAVEQMHVGASFMLGKMLHLGYGVEKNIPRALELLKFAANAGEAQAQYYLGYIFENGLEVPKDTNEADKWFKLSAEQGTAEAQFVLGDRYSLIDKPRGLLEDSYKPEQLKSLSFFRPLQDVSWKNSMSYMWYRLAAQQNHAEAAYRISQSYTWKSDDSVKWNKRAAINGYGLAQWSLWLMYSTGSTVTPKSDAEALKWLELVGEQENPKGYYRIMEAQYKLGQMYEKGTTLVKKDERKALALYTRAAKGDKSAQIRLGEIFRDGLSQPGIVEINVETALKWFELAGAKTQIEQLRATISDPNAGIDDKQKPDTNHRKIN